jgi:hypothetical protein
VKNKVAPPFREAEFDIMYGEGISKVGELIDLGVKLDLVQKSGSWFAMGELRLGQGRDAAKQFLRDNPDLADELEKIGLHRVHQGEFFHEFVTTCPQQEQVLAALDREGILGGLPVEGGLLWCATEVVTRSEMDRAVSMIKEVLGA